jgi:hypothetical protein
MAYQDNSKQTAQKAVEDAISKLKGIASTGFAGSASSGNIQTQGGSYTPPAHPCPTCGRCPTCGSYHPVAQPQITWTYQPTAGFVSEPTALSSMGAMVAQSMREWSKQPLAREYSVGT